MKKTIVLELSIEEFLSWMFAVLKKYLLINILVLSFFFFIFHYLFISNYGTMKFLNIIDTTELNLKPSVFDFIKKRTKRIFINSRNFLFTNCIEIKNAKIVREKVANVNMEISKFNTYEYSGFFPIKYKKYFDECKPIIEKNYLTFLKINQEESITSFYQEKFQKIYFEKILLPFKIFTAFVEEKNNNSGTVNLSEIKEELDTRIFLLYGQNNQNYLELKKIVIDTFNFIENIIHKVGEKNFISSSSQNLDFFDKYKIKLKNDLTFSKENSSDFLEKKKLVLFIQEIYSKDLKVTQAQLSVYKNYVIDEINRTNSQYQKDLEKSKIFLKKLQKSNFKIDYYPFEVKSFTFILGLYFLLVSFILIFCYISFKVILAFK